MKMHMVKDDISPPQTWEPQPFRLDFVGERAEKLVQIKDVNCIS